MTHATPPATAWEQAAQWLTRATPAERFPRPGDLATYLDPATRDTPALHLIDDALTHAITTGDQRLIITMPPQEGKSTRASLTLPHWHLLHHPSARIIIASYGQSLAIRNGRAIRRQIAATPELGLTIDPSHRAAHDWTLHGHPGGVYSTSIGGSLTGRACDLLIIDDPVKSWAEAYSPAYRDHVWDWWRSEAASRLGPGATVVLITTRWHHDDLAGRLQATSGWTTLNIPARCDNPATDPLHRDLGEYMQSARGRTQAQWEQREREAGPATWAALYQGSPAPDGTLIFPPHAWARWTLPPWTTHPDGTRHIPGLTHDDTELIQSWDLTFTGGPGSDYAVGQIWLRRGPAAYLLDQVRGRWDATETIRQIRHLTARWPQATAKLIEDTANGPAVISLLRHEIPGILPIRPAGPKTARALAIQPLTAAGNVLLPPDDHAPWAGDIITEAEQFPAGAHDDQIDAMTQAIHRLLLVPLTPPPADALTALGDDPAAAWHTAATAW